MIEFKIAVSDDWMDFAACKGAPPELFFSDESNAKMVAAAKIVCNRCPVSDPCGDMAMRFTFGIWGGMTASERMMLRKL
jgi:hypothetical protein